MNKILIIGGPTGIGKSSVAIEIARKLNGAIVGADAMQIYRRLDIGTGKVTEEEKCGIFHTMIDIVEPNEEYSVQKYVLGAKKSIAEIQAMGKLPIITGGTGLYINALINEQNFADVAPDIEVRKKYNEILSERGATYLHDLLKSVDCNSAMKISENDTKRVIRALEIYEKTGKAKSEVVSEKKSAYDFKFFVLEADRQVLYDKINSRVDGMIENGLIDEVCGLERFWQCRSMEAIGYKEIIKAIKNGDEPIAAVDEIKRNSRRYAKRQITFFKWITAEKKYVSEDYCNNILKESEMWLRS